MRTNDRGRDFHFGSQKVVTITFKGTFLRFFITESDSAFSFHSSSSGVFVKPNSLFFGFLVRLDSANFVEAFRNGPVEITFVHVGWQVLNEYLDF